MWGNDKEGEITKTMARALRTKSVSFTAITTEIGIGQCTEKVLCIYHYLFKMSSDCSCSCNEDNKARFLSCLKSIRAVAGNLAKEIYISNMLSTFNFYVPNLFQIACNILRYENYYIEFLHFTLLTFWIRSFFVMWAVLLCIIGSFVTSLATMY